MAIFRCGVESASPLLFQLRASTVAPVVVTSFIAQGTSAAGATSRPLVYIPAAAGRPAVSGNIVCLSNPGQLAQSTFADQFAIPPTTPPVGGTTSNLPLNVTWAGPADQGWILGPGSALCAFAQTTRPHAWNAQFIFEEL